jgi:hypothetical protein
MLELFMAPQMEELQPLIYQQAGTPLYWSLAKGEF